LHVCQDEHGFWFTTQEFADGSLTVVAHAGQLEEAMEVAARTAARLGGVIVWVEGETKPYPEGGLVPGYTKPAARMAIKAI
jgi:hypothetical protein